MTRHVSRTALIALAVLAAFALLGPVWPGARLSVSTGKVEIGRGEPPVWKLASSGEALGAGDRVRTGDDGRAEVVIEGSTVRVYPNSLLRLPEASTTRKMELEKGSSLFDVLHNGEPFDAAEAFHRLPAGRHHGLPGERRPEARDGEPLRVAAFAVPERYGERRREHDAEQAEDDPREVQDGGHAHGYRSAASPK